MPIRVRVTLFDAGANGAPTTNNPHTLRNLDSYEHTIVNEGGFESLQVSFRVATRAAAQAYLDRLMCGVIATSPRGRTVWEGFVQEVTAEIDGTTTTISLADMANQIVVRYKDTAGAQAAASPVTDAASIARYGTKTRLINFATTTPTAATNRAGVVLKQIGNPRSKQKRSAGSGNPSTGYKVTLVCRGWWDTLAWLLVASVSTSTTVTSAQALALIIAYNATNNFFSADATNVVATGVSDTETIEDDTTYQDAIATKLASGDNSLQRVVFGCYEGRRITIRPWAYATPTSYTYVQRGGDPTVRDAYGSIVPIWDVRPDAIVLLPDHTLPASTSTALDRANRMYLRRVRVRLGRTEQSIELEPDDADSIEELLTRPNGSGVTGTSARQAAIERVVTGQARTRFSGVNGTIDLGGGSIDTGGGSIDLDSGGGTITLPGGGGTVTLPGGGGGSASVVSGSGTTGSLAKWTGSGALGNAVAGTDYVAPAALDEAIDDRVSSLLVAGNLISLSYNDASNSLTIAVSSLNETIDDRVAALLTAGTGISLGYNDAGNALTITAVNNGTVGGTGTAGRLTQWASGGANIENSTLVKSGAGVLTLSASSTETLTIASGGSGTLDLNTNTLTLNSSLTFNAGTTGRLAGYTATGTLDDSTVAKTGTGVLTLATGTTTLTLTLSGGSGQIDFTTPSSNDALIYDGSKFTPTPISSSTVSNFNEAVDDRVAALLVAGSGIGLSYNDASNTLTISNTGGSVGGTGTAGRITQWATGGANIENSTLAKTGAGVLTLSAASAFTATIAATGTVAMGTGVADRITYWSGPNTITSNANLEFDGLDLYTNSIRLLANVYVGSSQVLGARRTGWAAASGTATRSTFDTATVTVAALAQRVKALIDDFMTHGAIGA